MQIEDRVMDPRERIGFLLRSLYAGYGYNRYRMGKFEEYDLYSRNKDFLFSEGVITFTDTNGRLMALKPDVTLSIVKNRKDTPPVCLLPAGSILFFDQLSHSKVPDLPVCHQHRGGHGKPQGAGKQQGCGDQQHCQQQFFVQPVFHRATSFHSVAHARFIDTDESGFVFYASEKRFQRDISYSAAKSCHT